MHRFAVGDRVRVDIPDESDPDHERFHGMQGAIVDVLDDDAHLETGDERDAIVYRVDLDSDGTKDFRWRDLRPASGNG